MADDRKNDAIEAAVSVATIVVAIPFFFQLGKDLRKGGWLGRSLSVIAVLYASYYLWLSSMTMFLIVPATMAVLLVLGFLTEEKKAEPSKTALTPEIRKAHADRKMIAADPEAWSLFLELSKEADDVVWHKYPEKMAEAYERSVSVAVKNGIRREDHELPKEPQVPEPTTSPTFSMWDALVVLSLCVPIVGLFAPASAVTPEKCNILKPLCTYISREAACAIETRSERDHLKCDTVSSIDVAFGRVIVSRGPK